jgi:hypothetical protein
MRKNKLFTSILLVFISLNVFSQNNTNSPYSHYGIGEVDLSGFSPNRAMGGVGIALRNPNQINYLNPASYNSQDSMSFIVDVGFFGKYTTMATSSEQSKIKNFNIDHIAISFPVYKKYYCSVGIMPYSSKGYEILDPDTTESGDSINVLQTGSGGLNQLFIGNSFGLLNDKLHLGVNVSFLFGNISSQKSVSLVNQEYNSFTSYYQKQLSVKGVVLNFGLQYIYDLNPDYKITAGFVYDPKMKLKAKYSDKGSWYYSNSGTDVYNKFNNDTTMTFPSKLGAGINIAYKNKLQLEVDYTRQNWNEAKIPGLNENLVASNKISVSLYLIRNQFVATLLK